MTFLIPIGNDVILHPIEPESKIGSLYVLDPSKKRVNQGIVIAKGPACEYDDIRVADHVLFNGYTGDKIAIDEMGVFFAVPETHLVAKIEHSGVVLMDTETVKRIIQERFGELKTRYEGEPAYIYHEDIDTVEKDLLDRIDTITIAEGWEF